MEKIFLLPVISMFALCGCVGQTGEKNVTEQEGREICFADPTVIRENGKFYLTGTGDNRPQGFTMLESEDLKTWHVMSGDSVQYILKEGDHVFGDKGFWAPQWFKDDADGGKVYFTYTANEQTVLAEAATWQGPFRQDEVKPIDGSEKNIDSYLFRDDDGRYYLYHVRFNRGNYIWVGEFDMQKKEIKPGTLRQCLDCTEAWERTSNYISDPIMEGPTVMKMDSVYYLFYSANHFMNIDYAVGYATASSPLGPWKKSANNPIIHRSIVKENGSGHGDVFTDDKGKYYYVYHVHASDTAVSPRKTRIVPLVMKKNREGAYDISVDANGIIKPNQK